MIHTLTDLKKEFDSLLANINGSPVLSFTSMAEMAYEAVVCVRAINEYSSIYGPPISVVNPKKFLNQKPGKFHPTRSFRVQFKSVTFYFATDVKCHGLAAFNVGQANGDVFEADVVVIEDKYVNEIQSRFHGMPGPQHLNAAYECKFGKYSKGQLRELLGFRRYMSLLTRNGPNSTTHPMGHPFRAMTSHSAPEVQIILFRPRALNFLTRSAADYYDLSQIVYP